MWEALKRTDAAGRYKAACYRAVTAAGLRAGTARETVAAPPGSPGGPRGHPARFFRPAVSIPGPFGS